MANNHNNEYENNLRLVINALLKNQPVPDLDLGDYATNPVINLLKEKMPESPHADKVLKAIRSMKNNKWLDELLKEPVSEDYEPDEQQTEENDPRFTTSQSTQKRLLKLHSIDDIYALPDTTYLITKVLKEVGVSMLYGMSGTGKTFTALNLALSVAHGLNWMSRKVKQGPVWYVNTEGGRELKNRLKAWYEEHDELLPSPHFQVIPWSLSFRENMEDLVNTIDEMSEEDKPALIVFDNFSMCAPGINQNNQEEVAPVLRDLNTLAQMKSTHVMVIHHSNKLDDINGTMAFRNHVDTMIELKKEDKSDKQSPILFCCQKARDDEPFSDIRTELKQIILYTDPQSLETITSCVVTPSETRAKEKALNDTPANMLDILGDRSLIHSDWQRECLETLKIGHATFDRYRQQLIYKKYIEKYKPEGQKIDHYRKTEASDQGNENDCD